jgi:hypothetical protein
MMKLFTKAQYELLIKQGTNQDGSKDHIPVVKWFTPDANCTWLISEIDPNQQDIAFGLCDLGLGMPELGYVSISEIREVRGRFGLPVERDLHFRPVAPLSIYSEAARRHQQIIDKPNSIETFLNESKQAEECELQKHVMNMVESEVICNVSQLVSQMTTSIPTLFEDYPGLFDAVDSDGEPLDIYEYWIISDWLAEQLKQRGEAVETDCMGLTIWGRTTSGQAIAMDGVIRDIYQKNA